MSRCLSAILIVLFSLLATIKAEDGYRLWLLPAAQIGAYRAWVRSLVVTGNSEQLTQAVFSVTSGIISARNNIKNYSSFSF